MTGWLVYAFHLQPYFRQAPQFHWLQATDLAEYKTCSRLLHQWYRWYQPARNFNGNCVRVINLLFIGEKGKGVRSSSWGMGGGRVVVDQEMATLTCVDNINPPEWDAFSFQTLRVSGGTIYIDAALPALGKAS